MAKKDKKIKPKGGNKGEDFTGKNKYDRDWPPPVNQQLPKV